MDIHVYPTCILYNHQNNVSLNPNLDQGKLRKSQSELVVRSKWHARGWDPEPENKSVLQSKYELKSYAGFRVSMRLNHMRKKGYSCIAVSSDQQIYC
jgi:hypothetical protein